MALLKCPDCGGNVSDSAPTCPHCGRPMHAAPPAPPVAPPAPAPAKPAPKAKKNSGCGTLILVVIVVVILTGIFSSNDKKPAATSPVPVTTSSAYDDASKDANCSKDLNCAGEKHLVHASVYCKDKIEAKAAHDVKWSDGMLSPSMSRYRWGNDQHTSITYLGDKVAFQNGFGAYTPMTYLCTVDVATDAILSVAVIEGRLPTD